MLDPKNQLDITLTEPVIFLRSSDPSGRHEADPNDPPTLVRGILTLNVVKAIGISSIEAELTGLLTISYPEGITSRHTDFHEKHKIYSSTVIVFRADQVLQRKRPASVGPVLSSSIPNSNNEHASSSRPPSSPLGRSERRSAVTGVTPDLGPTPPYTSVPQPPQTPIWPRISFPGESPAQTLEELRQALRGNLERQAHQNAHSEQLIPPSPYQCLATPSSSNSTVHSDTSIASSESLHRESHTASPAFSRDTSYHNTVEEPPRILPHRRPSPCRSSRSGSPEYTHGLQHHARRNGHDFSGTPAGRSRLRLSISNVLDTVMQVTSRAPSRSRVVTGPEEGERGRTRVRIIDEEQNRGCTEVAGGSVGTGNGSQLAANAFNPSGHVEHREHHLLALGRVLGLHRDHEKEKDVQQKSKEQGEGWREFKPGTYSYPISFLLPPNLPPTFSIPRGSLDYTIKGVAHRPGTFTSKLSCQVPLLVVTAPTAGAGEGGGPGDPGPLFFQRQWEGKLAYSFELSSRLLILGSQRHLEATTNDGIRTNTESLAVGAEAAEVAYGTATLDLTLLPLEKIKIWRLSVFVDQHIKCLYGQRNPFRDEDTRRVRLVDVQDTCPAEEIGLVDEQLAHENKHKHKHDLVQIPLLPTPTSPHRSPLLRYITPSADPSVLAGPGPYTLSTTIGLPDCSDPGNELHFTVKQKSSVVRVEHSLRLVMRVERVSEESSNHREEGDKKKFFDITVQTPISILSCRCVPEYQTLPKYSLVTEDGLPNRAACPCRSRIMGPMEHGQGHEVGNHIEHAMSSSTRSSFESEDGVRRQTNERRNVRERSRSHSRARRTSYPRRLTTPLLSHSPSPARTGTCEVGWSGSHVHDISSQYHQLNSASTSSGCAQSHTTPASTPHSSGPPSPLARYARLVSGLESEAGEAPPSYESVASRF